MLLNYIDLFLKNDMDQVAMIEDVAMDVLTQTGINKLVKAMSTTIYLIFAAFVH